MILSKWLTTVTPFSKAVAMAIFVIIPFVAFILGMKFQQELGEVDRQEGEISIEEESGGVGMANPAAVYCVEQGGKDNIITAPDGSQTGECSFEDGRTCDDWEYFRTKVCE